MVIIIVKSSSLFRTNMAMQSLLTPTQRKSIVKDLNFQIMVNTSSMSAKHLEKMSPTCHLDNTSSTEDEKIFFVGLRKTPDATTSLYSTTISQPAKLIQQQAYKKII
jgi:patatin-like phospholipase/acyl hydrolase